MGDFLRAAGRSAFGRSAEVGRLRQSTAKDGSLQTKLWARTAQRAAMAYSESSGVSRMDLLDIWGKTVSCFWDD